MFISATIRRLVVYVLALVDFNLQFKKKKKELVKNVIKSKVDLQLPRFQKRLKLGTNLSPGTKPLCKIVNTR